MKDYILRSKPLEGRLVISTLVSPPSESLVGHAAIWEVQDLNDGSRPYSEVLAGISDVVAGIEHGVLRGVASGFIPLTYNSNASHRLPSTTLLNFLGPPDCPVSSSPLGSVFEGQASGCDPLQLHGLHGSDRLEPPALESFEDWLEVSYPQVGFDVEAVTMAVDLASPIPKLEAMPACGLALPDPLRAEVQGDDP
jgi:hypothetical protein